MGTATEHFPPLDFEHYGTMPAMTELQSLPFDDAETVTQRPALNVVHAAAKSVRTFDIDYFAGFATMRALTYSTSIPMITGLLRDRDFETFECVFGHSGILSREAAEILAFQNVVAEKLANSVFALKGLTDERRELIYARVANGSLRFFVVKDAIAHAKIYLLEGLDKRRVIVGSANLSERAFSGRQAETLIVFDDDTAWRHYREQYEAVRDAATSELPLSVSPPLERVRIEQTPALVEAHAHPGGTTLFVPGGDGTEDDYSVPKVVTRMEAIKPALRRGMANVKPDRRGRVRIVPRIVKEIVSIAQARDIDAGPPVYLSRSEQRFTLSDQPLSLEAPAADVRGDVAAWLEFFGNYESGFVGDVARLQHDYFTFMCWFYLAPLMCDLRNAALAKHTFSFDQPLFAVLYGSSNCGKTSLVEALMTSMFAHPRIVETQDFTPGKLRALQQAYKRFPVVFDDVTRDRFSRHADEIIKDETIPYAEYPCFALSMNADARSFKPEIVKRCLMIYTRTSLPGDNTVARRRLQRSVAAIRERMTTSLYREYLRRAVAEVDAAAAAGEDGVDALELSANILCPLFEEHLPVGAAMPHWCKPMTLADYQQRAFDRPRSQLEGLLHADRYHAGHRPPEGWWNLRADKIAVSVAPMDFARTRNEIPDWLLDDAGSTVGQILLDRNLAEEFLGRKVRRPRRFRWFRA